MTDVRELIGELKDLEERFITVARGLREKEPRMSWEYFKFSETAKHAAEELERMKPVQREMEGGGYNWFFVCEECHGQVAGMDKYCRHCGHPLEDEK